MDNRSTQLTLTLPVPLLTVRMSRSRLSLAKHANSHHQQTTLLTLNKPSNALTQEGQNLKTPGGVSGGLPVISERCIPDHVTLISPLTT